MRLFGWKERENLTKPLERIRPVYETELLCNGDALNKKTPPARHADRTANAKRRSKRRHDARSEGAETRGAKATRRSDGSRLKIFQRNLRRNVYMSTWHSCPNRNRGRTKTQFYTRTMGRAKESSQCRGSGRGPGVLIKMLIWGGMSELLGSLHVVVYFMNLSKTFGRTIRSKWRKVSCSLGTQQSPRKHFSAPPKNFPGKGFRPGWCVMFRLSCPHSSRKELLPGKRSFARYAQSLLGNRVACRCPTVPMNRSRDLLKQRVRGESHEPHEPREPHNPRYAVKYALQPPWWWSSARG